MVYMVNKPIDRTASCVTWEQSALDIILLKEDNNYGDEIHKTRS